MTPPRSWTGSVLRRASVFAIKGCIERGEFVALLGDRVGIGDEKRTGRVCAVVGAILSDPYQWFNFYDYRADQVAK